MRVLGYLFGLLLLADGLPTIFSPHFWVNYANRNWKGVLPGPALSTISDFGHLSDNAVRAKAVTEIMFGMMMLFLASMVPTRYVAFRGGPPRGMLRHKHPHVHEGMPGGMHTHEHVHGEEGMEEGMEGEEAL